MKRRPKEGSEEGRVGMTSAEIDERIARAMADIRPETAFEGRLGPPHELAERMAFCHTPGMGLALVEGFELAWAGGFGQREAGSVEPVTADTLFQAASISKPVMALAVMRLVQDGMLEPDRDVNDYLVSWRGIQHSSRCGSLREAG
jgi:CubicO group peptidase (beta-lactamase class C family)